MKKTVKLLSLAATVIGCMNLASCGNKNEGGAQVLRIFVTQAGYKTAWVDSMIEEFKKADWVKEKYPNLDVRKPYISNQQTYVQDKFAAGEKANTYDLLFGLNLFENIKNNYFLDLTEVLYDQQIPDSIGGKYKDRMYSSYVDSFKYTSIADDPRNGRFYMAPWAGGNVSFLYNVELLESINMDVPVTTDEFLACCEAYTVKNYKGEDSTTTYALSKGGNSEDYINKMFYTWWAQYEGLQNYDNFWNGIDDGGISPNIFKQKGRLESLKVYEELLNRNKHHYISPVAFQNDFMFNQRGFKGGNALFYANGDWYPSEMAAINGMGGKNYQAKMMRTPILSAIIEQTTTIENDAELAALVRAIDAENPALSGEGYSVNQDDYDIVKEARSVVWSFGSGHCAVIPTYAPGKDVAVDFLKFMATKTGLETYMKKTMGASLPFTYDVKQHNPTLYNSSEIDPLHRERLDYMNSDFIKPYTLKSVTSSVLCLYGPVNEWAPSFNRNYWDVFTNTQNTLTAQKYYDDTIAYYNEGSHWSDAVNNAGLNV